jgi:hypothetical protein
LLAVVNPEQLPEDPSGDPVNQIYIVDEDTVVELMVLNVDIAPDGRGARGSSIGRSAGGRLSSVAIDAARCRAAICILAASHFTGLISPGS